MTLREKAYILLPLFSCLYLTIVAQVPGNFSFQKDDEGLKKNYYVQSVQKRDSWLAGLDKKHAAGYRSVYESQFEEISRLWESSRSVTDPVAHGYLQDIVKKIIAANPELRNTDARIVFTRDWWPNAASMGDGTIVINAGLLVYLENEAELVFVLCHEFSHYYLDHTGKAIRKYVETVNDESFQKELKRLAKTEYGANKRLEELSRSITFSNRMHSRDNEAEADRYAFSFMKNTGYDVAAIRSCLELLDKVDDSTLYKPLELPAVLNFKDYPFRKKWIERESSIFSQMADDESPRAKKEADSLKTHPNCDKRIAMLQDSIAAQAGAGNDFLVNEEVFRKLKKDFFVEMMEQCYREKNLSRNLYYGLLLLQSGENTPVAVYSVARCLHAIYTEQKNHTLGKKIDSEKAGYPKDYSLLLRMLGKLRLEEIASINYHLCKQYQPVMAEDAGFQEIMKAVQSLKQ